MGENKRDYKKEHERTKELNKTYIVKVPTYIAKPFDEKLKNNGLRFSDFVKNAIEKYLKKS